LLTYQYSKGRLQVRFPEGRIDPKQLPRIQPKLDLSTSPMPREIHKSYTAGASECRAEQISCTTKVLGTIAALGSMSKLKFSPITPVRFPLFVQEIAKYDEYCRVENQATRQARTSALTSF